MVGTACKGTWVTATQLLRHLDGYNKCEAPVARDGGALQPLKYSSTRASCWGRGGASGSGGESNRTALGVKHQLWPLPSVKHLGRAVRPLHLE